MSNVGRQTNSIEAKTGQGYDTFSLTGTTVAGTTQMIETGQGDGPWVSIEDEGHTKLLVEAEMRAEHQAQARATMLDLARALDESNKSRHDLGGKLKHEYESSALLRRQRDRLQNELDRIHEEEEKKQADAMVEKALKSGNKFFFNMMLEKSRDVYDFSLFEPEGSSTGGPKKSNTTAAGEQRGPSQQLGETKPGFSAEQPGPSQQLRQFQPGSSSEVQQPGTGTSSQQPGIGTSQQLREMQPGSSAEQPAPTQQLREIQPGFSAELPGPSQQLREIQPGSSAEQPAPTQQLREIQPGSSSGVQQPGTGTSSQQPATGTSQQPGTRTLQVIGSIQEPIPEQLDDGRGSVPSAQSVSLTDVMQNAVGDKVTMKWVVKLWWQEVVRKKERLEEERLAAEKRRKEEEERRKVEDAKKAAMEKVAKMVEDLKQRLENSQKTVEEHEKRMKALELELQAERDKKMQDAANAKAREDALTAEKLRLEAEKGHMQKALSDMQADYDASQESLRKAAEDFAAERNTLRGQLRNISSELAEAMVMAKHMRELALKSKREAAQSVSPQKFAELMAHLEEMKNNLSALMKECNLEKDNSAWLLRCLDKNKRQLELERQFLPLLRKVRGPVGPKAHGDETLKKKEVGMPPIAHGSSPMQMRGSQSLGALGAPAAGVGPLGRQSAAVQDGYVGSATTLR